MTQRSFVHALFSASVVVLLITTACGDDDSSVGDAGPTAGKAGGGANKCGGGGKGGSGGSADKCSGGSGGSGGKAGTGGTSTAGTSAPAAGVGGLGTTLTCSEEPPKDPVKCGDETCSVPMDFAMNMCVVPCCVKVNGKDRCASKSTAAMLTTECTLPAQADSQCPDVAGGTGGMSYKGCCNAEKKKCGIISPLRPGCITESMLLTLPSPLQDCTPPEEPADDAGVGDAG